jgi:hypothetical protein
MNPRDHLPAAKVSDRRKTKRDDRRAPGPGLLARLMQRGTAMIGAQRHKCCVVGVLVLVDRSVPIDGLVTELDAESCLFRPASTYILDRTGAEVLLRFGEREMRATIASVSPKGYVAEFHLPQPEAFVAGMTRPDGASDGAGPLSHATFS